MLVLRRQRAVEKLGPVAVFAARVAPRSAKGKLRSFHPMERSRAAHLCYGYLNNSLDVEPSGASYWTKLSG
jgi:hypothetical protein